MKNFLSKIVKWWKHKMAVHPKSETSLKLCKGKWNSIEKEWKNLQNILKSAANESLRKIKGRNRRKYLKIWDDQIKLLIGTKKKSYKKWLNSKKLEDKHKRNTALAKREVRRRQRLSWDKFVANLEHETYRTQPKVYKILIQIGKDVKETACIQGNIIIIIIIIMFLKG